MQAERGVQFIPEPAGASLPDREPLEIQAENDDTEYTKQKLWDRNTDHSRYRQQIIGEPSFPQSRNNP